MLSPRSRGLLSFYSRLYYIAADFRTALQMIFVLLGFAFFARFRADFLRTFSRSFLRTFSRNFFRLTA